MTVYQLRSLIPVHMPITSRYLLGHELLCAVGICELHLESGSITAASWLSVGSATRGENIALSTAMAAVSARREVVLY